MPDTESTGAAASEKPWLVYILRCADGTLYTGITNDLPRRLKRHNDGVGARYTRSRLPVELAWQERQPSRGDALRRERAIKRLSRPEKLALLAGGQGSSARSSA